MSTLFSGHYLRNRSNLDIGVLGYIGIVQHKEHPPEVWSFPPVTPCIRPAYGEGVSSRGVSLRRQSDDAADSEGVSSRRDTRRPAASEGFFCFTSETAWGVAVCE